MLVFSWLRHDVRTLLYFLFLLNNISGIKASAMTQIFQHLALKLALLRYHEDCTVHSRSLRSVPIFVIASPSTEIKAIESSPELGVSERAEQNKAPCGQWCLGLYVVLVTIEMRP